MIACPRGGGGKKNIDFTREEIGKEKITDVNDCENYRAKKG